LAAFRTGFHRAISSNSPKSRHFLAFSPLSRHYLAMNRPIKREWLNPFRQQPELEAQAYEVGFEPRLPRRTALNPNSEVAGGFNGILTTDYTDFHGFKNTPNRFENRFHNSFIIRVHPCNPWFNFGFRVESPGSAGSARRHP